mmetsp:Transcript_27483/g.46108  ORF Transcript_27483/g.46108 Transcript_27483/m.46108 type:complete len:417 (+) Transcript_27483:383-1633(+)
MGCRQQTDVSVTFMNGKSLRAAHSLQIGKSAKWYLAGTRHEMQKRRAFFAVELPHGRPEPADDRVARLVLVVLGGRVQLVDVHLGQAADEQLQLGGREQTDELGGNEVVEALQEGVDLCADGGGHAVVRDQADVVTFVFVRHGDVPPVGDQVHHFRLAELVDLRREGQIQHEILQRILHDLLERLVVIRVCCLYILEVHGYAKHVLVKRPREVRIHELSIANGFANDSAHKFEVIQVVGIDHTQRIGLEGGAIDGCREERIVGVEDLSGQNNEPLPTQAPRVHAFLAVEVHLQAPAHLLCGAHAQLVEGVLEHLVAADLQVHAAGPAPSSCCRARVLIEQLQLREEVLAFVVELQERAQLSDAHEGAEGLVQQGGASFDDQVQKTAVRLHELQQPSAAIGEHAARAAIKTTASAPQ